MPTPHHTYRFRMPRHGARSIVVLTSGTTEIEAARAAVEAAGIRLPVPGLIEGSDRVACIVAVARVGRLAWLKRALRRLFMPSRYEVLVRLDSGRHEIITLYRA